MLGLKGAFSAMLPLVLLSSFIHSLLLLPYMLRSSSSFQFFLFSLSLLFWSLHLSTALRTLQRSGGPAFISQNKSISFPLRFTLPLKERRRKKEDSVASVAIGKKELSSPLPKGSALRVFDGESVAQSDAL